MSTDRQSLAGAVTEIEADPGEDGPLYAPAKRVYPQSVQGTFRRIKWILLVVTLGIYYGLPFVRWDRGPNAPDQAVLVDFPARRFYFFFIEIWPQEIYYLTGLLVLAAMALFFMNAVAGRVWCGYLCPQTVWTDLFYAVERYFEGDRRERMRNAAGRLTLDIALRKVAKHVTWLMIAWWTGGAWVLYFADAPTLVKELATFTAQPIAYIWIAILTFTTYSLAGFMREQVCIYMCPWPRIQAALTDEWALNVTYLRDRGEQRMSLKKSAEARAAGLPAGDCVDCHQCVNVCPVGIDIRNGLQMDCIQCGLCIDACDNVMEKIGRPTRLIAYDTDINIARRQAGKNELYRIVRPRTIAYAVMIALVGSTILYALANRSMLNINVLHDRNPIAVRLADGSIRNAYTVRLLNKRDDRAVVLDVEGLPRAIVHVVGQDTAASGRSQIVVGRDRTTELRVLVTAPAAAARSMPLTMRVTDVASGETATAVDNFVMP